MELANTCIRVEQAYFDNQWHNHVEVTLCDGKISRLSKVDPTSCQGSILLPAFVDLQVNGGGDVQFNQMPTLESLIRIAQAHARGGTGAWLPTVTSDSLTVMHQAADAVASALTRPELGVLGIHFEGPHLAASKRGIHPLQYLCPLSNDHLSLYSRQDIGKVVVTVAPEVVSPEQIKALVERGIIVLLGHSNAGFEQTQQALAAGASGFTHLFNAMSQFNSRQPGMVGAALGSEYPYGIILDGHHVHFASARAAYHANPNLVLVTDAMAVVGGDRQQFEFDGETIQLCDGRLRDGKGRLAGSAIAMIDAVQNARVHLDMDWQELTAAAYVRPRRLLGLSSAQGTTEGQLADLVLLDPQQMRVMALWRSGRLVFGTTEAVQ